jgi:hypothetical protein
MFRSRRCNVDNFVLGPDTMWTPNFPGSEIIAWREKFKATAVDLVVVGELGRFNLADAHSPFKESAYRVELLLNQTSADALTGLFNNGPLRDTPDFHSPLFGRTASFSAKLKSLIRTDRPKLTIDKPFPYVWDGKDLARGDKLVEIPASRVASGLTVAVETQISTFTMPDRTGYTMSLRSVFVLDDLNTHPSLSSTPNRKRPGGDLVSPRKNKIAGQRAVFSDSDE